MAPERKLESQPVASGRRQSHMTDYTIAHKAGSTRVGNETVRSGHASAMPADRSLGQPAIWRDPLLEQLCLHSCPFALQVGAPAKKIPREVALLGAATEAATGSRRETRAGRASAKPAPQQQPRKAQRGKVATAAPAGRRVHLSEAEIDGETFAVGDSVYVVLNPDVLAGLWCARPPPASTAATAAPAAAAAAACAAYRC
jgi:hypothetical protein